ncbi:hypothetical protein D3C76_717840 [compost metagenome]
MTGQLVEVDGLLQVGFHQHDDFLQLRLVGAERVPERHTLLVLLVPDAFVDEHVGDGRRQVPAMGAANQMQHHVHRRGTARRRIAVAVDGKQTGAGRRAREGFLQRGQTLPVDAAQVAIEQPGLGQRPAAGADGANLAAMAGLQSQPVHMFAAYPVLNVHAAANDHGIQGRSGIQAGIRGDLQAVAGTYRPAVPAQGEPAVQLLARQLVGHAQWLHRGGQ